MINAPQAVKDALTSGNFIYANLITINLGDVYGGGNDRILYYTDYHTSINLGGKNYTPNHNIVEIDGISRKASTGSDKLELSFSVTDPAIIQAIKTEKYVNKPTSINRCVIQDGSVLEGFLIPVRTAWGLSHSFSGGDEDRIVTLVIDSVLGALSADNGWYAIDSSHQQRYPNDRIMRHSPTVFTGEQKDKYTANFNGTIDQEVKPPALPKIYGAKNAELVPILMLKHRKSKTFYRHYFTTFIYVISIGECDYVDVNNIRLDDDSSDITVVTNTARDVGGWSCRVRTPADASTSSLLEENDNGDLGFWFEHMDVAEKNRLTGMRGEGLTLLFVKNRNRDDWLNSPPKITVPVRGAKVYDPRLGAYVGPYQTPTTVFSRNPALQYADYLRSVEYGAGERNIPITNSNIIELANHFDQIPDSIGNDGINSILIDVQIDTGKPIVDNMNVWMQGTRLYTSDYYGEFNVRVETKSSSVWTFNEDDLEGETQYESGDFTERLNSLTYTIKQLVQDESEGSQVGGGFGSQTDGGFDDNFYLQLGDLVEVDVETTFPEYGTAIHTAWLAEDGGIANFSSSSLDYVSEVDQALYWTMVDARISRQPRTLEIPVGAIGWLFETGDVIQHTSEIMEETNAYWRVSEVSENGGETVLNCIAYDDTFYVPDPNVVPTPIAFANPPITLTIPAVTGFELNVVNGEFYLQWDELNDSRVLWYAVEIYVGELLVQTNQRVSQSPLLITSPIVESYTANIVPYGINLEGEATLLEFDIYIPVTSTDDPTVTSKEGFITVAPPELESNKFTYEWQWYTSVDATVISGGTTIAKTISNVTPDVTYLIEYRIVTPNGKGDWESVSVNGIEKTTYIWYVYADNETGVGISLDPTGKTFFGIVAGKSVPTVDITDPTIFDYYQQPSGDATVGDGISAQLTKENYVVYTDGDGNNGDFSGASAKLNILVGSLNDTNSWTITTSESAGITGSLTGSTYTVGSLSAIQGLITFTATREDYPTFVRSFNIVKVQDGNSPSAIIPTITDNLDGTYTIDDGTVGGESIIVNNPIKGRDYFDGNDGSFVSFIYRNSVNQPTPAPVGGTFNGSIETYPDPTLNSDTPNYEDGKIVWVSTTRYSATSTGTGDDRVTTWSNSGWSAYSEYIIKGEVGDSIEVQYSPDTTAANFSAGFATNDLYMRQRVGTGGWTTPIRIVGEEGDGGDYTDYQFTLSAIQPTDDPDDPVDSTWTDSPSAATDTLFIWMIIGTKNHLGVIQGAGWSTPRRISGSKGETVAAKTLTLSATGSAFKYDKNGDLISDATITVTAATQGISTSLLWSNGGGGAVYTVSAASLGNNNSITGCVRRLGWLARCCANHTERPHGRWRWRPTQDFLLPIARLLHCWRRRGALRRVYVY